MRIKRLLARILNRALRRHLAEIAVGVPDSVLWLHTPPAFFGVSRPPPAYYDHMATLCPSFERYLGELAAVGFFEILEFGDLALGGHGMDGTENKIRQGEGGGVWV